MVANLETPWPSFRAMRIEDLEHVVRIEHAAYPFPWSYGIFRDCMTSGYDLWVLASPAAIVGYGVLSVAAGEAHLLNLCVAPGDQGAGHGRRILSRMIDLARWHRAERVFLEVRPSNHAAIALYDSAGFNEIGRRPGYYPDKRGREDALVMAIELLDTQG